MKKLSFWKRGILEGIFFKIIGFFVGGFIVMLLVAVPPGEYLLKYSFLISILGSVLTFVWKLSLTNFVVWAAIGVLYEWIKEKRGK